MSWPDAPALGTTVTLGQATWWLSPDCPVIGCACTGAVPPDDLCACHRRTVEARALHRAAHITARMLLDASRRRKETDGVV
jgi:hypothetical protein